MAGGWATDMDLFGSGPDGAIQSTDKPGWQIPDRIRDGLRLLGSLRFEQTLAIDVRVNEPPATDTYVDVEGWMDAQIDWDLMLPSKADTSAWNVVAVIWIKSLNSGVSWTPRLVLAGTSTEVEDGVAYSGTSWSNPYQTIVVPASTGVKDYRLQVKRSALTAGAMVKGKLRVYGP